MEQWRDYSGVQIACIVLYAGAHFSYSTYRLQICSMNNSLCIYDCYNESNHWLFVECLPEDGMYFIVSPKDIVTARQRDDDDHVSWLLEHEMFVVNLQHFSSTISCV